jgi:hypothetical protein
MDLYDLAERYGVSMEFMRTHFHYWMGSSERQWLHSLDLMREYANQSRREKALSPPKKRPSSSEPEDVIEKMMRLAAHKR